MKVNYKNKDLTPIIGLEVHCELRTASKLFCGCPADHFGKPPNTQTCPVCLGLPGELPVVNKKAVEWTQLLGLALKSEINKDSRFDRKHYFYPDLPMGFQISQYDQPFCVGGFIDTLEGRVKITRVHLEIDTGKLQHTNLDGEEVSLIDFNRSGVPLMEIVTEPDIKSGAQAKEYAKKLQQIIRYLGISDCDMEKGSMRLEANISWGLDLGYKVEVKNLNSFRFLEKAINYELKRQRDLIDKGEKVIQETRGWSETKQVTFSQRSKETAEDYRYFPDPDLPPMEFNDEYIKTLKDSLPKLPENYFDAFVKNYEVRKSFAEILSADKLIAEFAFALFDLAKKRKVNIDMLAGKIVNNPQDFSEVDIQKYLEEYERNMIVKTTNLKDLNVWIDSAMAELHSAVSDYKKGKVNAVAVLVGKVMQLSKGLADPQKVRMLLEKKLKEKTSS